MYDFPHVDGVFLWTHTDVKGTSVKVSASPHTFIICLFVFVSVYQLYLLQEGSEVACPPLVRFGQVDVFQVKDQILTVLGSEHPASVRAQQQAGLTELLEDMAGRGLCTAVNHGDLGGAQPREGVAQQHARHTKTQRKNVK